MPCSTASPSAKRTPLAAWLPDRAGIKLSLAWPSTAPATIRKDDQPKWRPDHFGSSLWGCSLDFRFPVVKLLDYAAHVPALEANPNPFAAIVLSHLKTLETRQDPEARRVWKARLVKCLYERGLSKEEIRQLFRPIDWMMDLPEELEERFWQEFHQYEEEKLMPYITSVERLAIKKELLTGLELALELKFGTEGLQFLPELRTVHDIDVLRAIQQAIRTATSLDDLRRITSSNKRDEER
jgi:hypothetical protein